MSHEAEELLDDYDRSIGRKNRPEIRSELLRRLALAESLTTEIENAIVAVKDKALLAIPSAIGFTQGDLQEIADVAHKMLLRIREAK